jgi:hypothetical protein
MKNAALVRRNRRIIAECDGFQVLEQGNKATTLSVTVLACPLMASDARALTTSPVILTLFIKHDCQI